MRRSTVALVLLGLLSVPAAVHASARHEVVGQPQKTARGARITLRLVPEGAYHTVTLGVSPGYVGRSGGINRVFETRLQLSGASERSYEIPYDGQFKSGGSFTIISQWPQNGNGRVHHWGDSSLTLP